MPSWWINISRETLSLQVVYDLKMSGQPIDLEPVEQEQNHLKTTSALSPILKRWTAFHHWQSRMSFEFKFCLMSKLWLENHQLSFQDRGLVPCFFKTPDRFVLELLWQHRCVLCTTQWPIKRRTAQHGVTQTDTESSLYSESTPCVPSLGTPSSRLLLAVSLAITISLLRAPQASFAMWGPWGL